MDFKPGDELPFIVTAAAGLVGRLMFHANEVQMRRRKAFSSTLAWDLPIALGMGWIALGIGTWLKLDYQITTSIALSISYLGPHGLDLAFARWAKYKGDDE